MIHALVEMLGAQKILLKTMKNFVKRAFGGSVCSYGCNEKKIEISSIKFHLFASLVVKEKVMLWRLAATNVALMILFIAKLSMRIMHTCVVVRNKLNGVSKQAMNKFLLSELLHSILCAKKIEFVFFFVAEKATTSFIGC